MSDFLSEKQTVENGISEQDKNYLKGLRTNLKFESSMEIVDLSKLEGPKELVEINSKFEVKISRTNLYVNYKNGGQVINLELNNFGDVINMKANEKLLSKVLSELKVFPFFASVKDKFKVPDFNFEQEKYFDTMSALKIKLIPVVQGNDSAYTEYENINNENPLPDINKNMELYLNILEKRYGLYAKLIEKYEKK